jgi:hypothetical protein
VPKAILHGNRSLGVGYSSLPHKPARGAVEVSGLPQVLCSQRPAWIALLYGPTSFLVKAAQKMNMETV